MRVFFHVGGVGFCPTESMGKGKKDTQTKGGTKNEWAHLQIMTNVLIDLRGTLSIYLFSISIHHSILGDLRSMTLRPHLGALIGEFYGPIARWDFRWDFRRCSFFLYAIQLLAWDLSSIQSVQFGVCGCFSCFNFLLLFCFSWSFSVCFWLLWDFEMTWIHFLLAIISSCLSSTKEGFFS